MTQDNLSPEDQHDFLSWEKGKNRGKLITGLLIMLFGVLFLMREMDVNVPRWIFSAPTILMAIGLVILIQHKFQKTSGYIVFAIGLIWRLNKSFPDMINMRIIIPCAIIIFGLSMIYKAKFGKSKSRKNWNKLNDDPKFSSFFGDGKSQYAPEDFIDAVSIFGAVKKNVTTKNFKGADLFTLFGGTEINLSHADIQQKAFIDLTTIFGGAEIIVPSDWNVQSEIVSILGGVEDNRAARAVDTENQKTLVLKGTCVFGGVEIKSYT
jgi:predicted membrane protein